MKHVSIFIIFFAFLGLKSSFAVEVKTVKHTDVSNSVNEEGMICPFHKSLERNAKKQKDSDLKKFIAVNEADTIDA